MAAGRNLGTARSESGHALAESRRTAGVIVAAYAFLALIFTYPLIFRITTHILGDGDPWLFTWNMWWMRFALLNGRNPLCTEYIHFPTGICAYLHTWVFPQTLLSIPLQSLFSTVTLYNLFALGSFVLAGFGMFRLAQCVGIGRVGAFLSGTAYSFSPYHFAHALGHLNLISYQWIPFFILSAFRGMQHGWSRRRILISSAWLILIALTDWYYFVFCLIAVMILMMVALLKQNSDFVWGTLKAGLVSVAVLSPLLIPMLRQAAGGIPEESVSKVFSADLQSFFVPGPISTFGAWFQPWNSKWTGVTAELGTFIPWSVWLLAIFGWRFFENRRWYGFWIAVFWILSLGPFLHVGGKTYEWLPLPYYWIEKIPGLGIMRAPIRFHVMTYLGICLLYGAGVERLLKARWKLFAGGALGVLVLTESLSLPLVTAAKDVSPFYSSLSVSADNGAVIDLHYAARALFYQTVHERKIMGSYGMVSRQSNEAIEFLKTTPVVKDLIAENQVTFYTNALPEKAVAEFIRSRNQDFTLAAGANLLRSGLLEVRTLQPHQLWVDDRLVSAPGATSSRVSLASGTKHRLQLRTRIEAPAGEVVSPPEKIRAATVGERPTNRLLTRAALRIELNGRRLEVRDLEPLGEVPQTKSEGMTCLFFAHSPQSGLAPAHAVQRLRQLGFSWIVLPFYGNDRFIRQGLGLSPAYQDHWIEAYKLE